MKKKKKKQNSNTQRYFVEGMHCASCEILIEKSLSEKLDVKNVKASLKDGSISLQPNLSSKVNKDQINNVISEYGYQVVDQEQSVKPLIQFEKGTLYLNQERLPFYLKPFLAVLLVVVFFILVDRFQIGRYISVNEQSSLPAFIILGLVAGISSCAALIGGVILSMSNKWHENNITSKSINAKSTPHLLFHIGRLLSFAILGGVLGAIGDAISLSNTTYIAIFTILVSVVMLVVALQMIGVQWAQNIKFGLPKDVSNKVLRIEKYNGQIMPFVLGFATFLLPCGFTLIAQTIALASGSFITGSLIMFLFALGTLPSLAIVSLSGVIFNSKPKLTAQFNFAAGIMIIFFAVYTINGQLNLLGVSSFSDIFKKNEQVSQLEIANDGEYQLLNVVAEGFTYTPTSKMEITAGLPARIVVDNQGIQGCGKAMAATGLIDGFVLLEDGINIIDIENPQKGSYKLTCSMGMVTPVIIEVI